MNRFVSTTVIAFSLSGCAGMYPTGGEDPNGMGDLGVDPNALIPLLSVTAPSRGLITEAAGDTVIGVASAASDKDSVSVMVQGAPVTLSETGEFAQEVEWTEGTNIISTVAVDSQNVMAVDFRSVVSGKFAPTSEKLDKGIFFQISTEALANITTDVQDFFTPEDMGDFIENPVLHEEMTMCMMFCYTAWGIEMNGYNPQFNDIDAVVNLRDGGASVVFTMHDFAMDWTGTGIISEMGYSGQGIVTAETMTVYMDLGVEWVNNTIAVNVIDVDVDSSGFEFDFDNFMYDAMGYFGMDLDMFVVGMVESTFATMMTEQVPLEAQTALQEMNIERVVTVMESEYLLTGEIQNVDLDGEGVSVSYKTLFTPPTSKHSDALGILSIDTTAPEMSSNEKVNAGISSNLLNQVFFGLWDGGALDMEMPGEMMGINAEDIAMMMPGVTEVVIATQAMLPPTITSNGPDDTGLAQFALGDLLMSLHDPNISMEQPLLTVAVSMTADLNLDATETGLVPNLSNVEVFPSIVSPPAGLTAGVTYGLGAMLTPLAQERLPLMMSGMMEFPLDLLEGYTFTNVEVEPGQTGYINVVSDLETE